MIDTDSMMTTFQIIFLCLISIGIIITFIGLVVNIKSIKVALTLPKRTIDENQKHKDARKLKWNYFVDESRVIGDQDRGYECTDQKGYRYTIGQSIEFKINEMNNLTQRIGHKLIITHPDDVELFISHYNENINELFEIASYHCYELDLENKKVYR